MVERMVHPQIQARTFAPLILARIAATGIWRASWTDQLLTWWVEEPDLRGYDEQLSWLHAVAHGADCIGRLGLLHPIDPAELLEAVAARLVVPTEYVWQDQEEDHVTAAVCAIRWAAEPANYEWLGPIRSLVPPLCRVRSSICCAVSPRTCGDPRRPRPAAADRGLPGDSPPCGGQLTW